MPHLRSFRPGDEPALTEICVRTALGGADATGVLDDDSLWGAIYAVPYALRHPELAFVVDNDEGRAVGYILGTPDTHDFEQWFHDEWWPPFAQRWSAPADDDTAQGRLLRYAAARAAGNERYADEYPAHLHIDLLPELQGQGWGRRLMATFLDALRRQGVTAVHLGMDPQNTGAAEFYRRTGFTQLTAEPGLSFGMHL